MLVALDERRPPRPAPAITSRTFVPSDWIWDFTAFEEPLPTAIRMITEATPIVIPRIVRPERSLVGLVLRHAMRSVSGPMTVASRARSHRWRGALTSGGGGQAARHALQ